jgi:hypothetical protein
MLNCTPTKDKCIIICLYVVNQIKKKLIKVTLVNEYIFRRVDSVSD